MKLIVILSLCSPVSVFAQLKWKNVDSMFATLPPNVHVYYTNDSLDGKPNIAYYVEASLKDKNLDFTVDTTFDRRQTPSQFFIKNHQPLLVVNCSFFEYTHNRNLNVVMKSGKLLSGNTHSIALGGKDTLLYHHSFGSALGISRKGNADVAWLFAPASAKTPLASQQVIASFKDSSNHLSIKKYASFNKWRMNTAVGGGPVLLQNGRITITNEEELKFTGKAINDKHPRTCMGYTNDGKLIVMTIQGRFPGKAEGATLEQEAKMLQEIGCIEALNLDGGGSSCMLVNGKQTITPSDKEGQRPVPAVFMIEKRN
jgi:hypothetical protein